MTCWCIDPVTKRSSLVRLAVLLSIGLHAAVGWWLLRNAGHVRISAPQPEVAERRFQVTLVPIMPLILLPKQPDLPAPIPMVRFERQLKTVPSKAQYAQTSRLAAQRQAVVTATAVLDSNTPPNATSPAAADTGLAIQPKLELGLGGAAQAIERQRRQSPLASAVDAQQLQTSAAKISRAFSGLEPVSSNIVEETMMAGGGRVIRFSGGGCMRMPNPSSRSHDDVRKPTMENC